MIILTIPKQMSKAMNSLLRLLVLSVVLTVAGCATGMTGSTQAPPRVNPETQSMAAYHIGVDDQIQVSVWHNPDLSASMPVRPGRHDLGAAGRRRQGRRQDAG